VRSDRGENRAIKGEKEGLLEAGEGDRSRTKASFRTKEAIEKKKEVIGVEKKTILSRKGGDR
jgi:hypothetical protein